MFGNKILIRVYAISMCGASRTNGFQLYTAFPEKVSLYNNEWWKFGKTCTDSVPRYRDILYKIFRCADSSKLMICISSSF